jgi:hypothetical protein
MLLMVLRDLLFDELVHYNHFTTPEEDNLSLFHCEENLELERTLNSTRRHASEPESVALEKF